MNSYNPFWITDPVKLGKIPDVNQEILAEQQQQSKLLRKGKSRLSRRKPTEDKMLSSETEPYVPNLQRMSRYLCPINSHLLI